MKQEDIDRLKEICDKEGFQVRARVMDKSVFEITVKDPWEGVCFVECVKDTDHKYYFKSKIYRVQYIDNSTLNIYTDNGELMTGISDYKKCDYGNVFKPSTEAEYVEQLKKEAFERYGEIKDGDKFQFYGKGFHSIKLSDTPDLDYFKEFDELSLWGFPLYKQGKWAKKLQERVEVEVNGRVWGDSSNSSYDFAFHFNVKNGVTKFNMNDCSIFLTEQLEKYLNNEINE